MISISDSSSLEMLRSISVSEYEGLDLEIENTDLTKKQFYSRVSSLIQSGLIRRKKGRLYITTFGKIITTLTAELEKAVENKWKLNAVDAISEKLDLDKSSKIPRDEIIKIISSLIDDPQIRDLVLKRYTAGPEGIHYKKQNNKITLSI